MELVYREWMKNQLTYKGTLFTYEAITKYVRELNRILDELKMIKSSGYGSLFEIKDVKEYDEICVLIKNDIKFQEFNESRHREGSSALISYGKFLINYSGMGNRVETKKSVDELIARAHKKAEELSDDELLKRIINKGLEKKLGGKHKTDQGKNNKGSRVPKKQKVLGFTYIRDADVAEFAKRRANGICDLCDKEAPFHNEDKKAYLEEHHLRWLSKKGTDTLDNAVALCPNCHRKMHVLASEIDVGKLREKIKKYMKLML